MSPAVTLAEFLEARIAEDERAANYATTRDVVDDRAPGGWGGWWIGHFHHYSRHDPARVLAECQAKRRIVGELKNAERMAEKKWHRKIRPEVDEYLRSMRIAAYALACVYYPHPEFTSDWAVNA